MTDPFIDSIDEAATALLKRAGASVEGGEVITLNEQVKAFEAAAKWAETRARLKTPTKKEPEAGGTFRRLKNKVNGARPSPRIAAEADADDSAG